MVEIFSNGMEWKEKKGKQNQNGKIKNLKDAIPSPIYVTKPSDDKFICRQDVELNFPSANTETRMERWIPNF